MSATLDRGHDLPLNEGAELSPRWVFRVVDVVSGTTLLDDADARATVVLLRSVESIFDVWIYVSAPELESWRQLSPGEHRILWNFRACSRRGAPDRTV